MTVTVVTDSSARIPAELAVAKGIRVVPLHILIDGADLRDGVDDLLADLDDRVASTAGASPAELAAAYRAALADSAGDGVVAACTCRGSTARGDASPDPTRRSGPVRSSSVPRMPSE
ncbi:DegV family protein [Mycolicibacterium insubricum]|nr:DegV family protein [Mycolicibacterium insubricum]